MSPTPNHKGTQTTNTQIHDINGNHVEAFYNLSATYLKRIRVFNSNEALSPHNDAAITAILIAD